MKSLGTHEPTNAATAIKRLKLTDQLKVDPLKALALIETIVVYLALMTFLLFFSQRLGITDTFKYDLLISGALGGFIGCAYTFYRERALSEWVVCTQISAEALQSAMLVLKYTEKHADVYYPKKRMLSLFYHCDSERITLKTTGDISIFTGPHQQLKKLAALPLIGSHILPPAPISDHT